jgi:hypothetical protein
MELFLAVFGQVISFYYSSFDRIVINGYFISFAISSCLRWRQVFDWINFVHILQKPKCWRNTLVAKSFSIG